MSQIYNNLYIGSNQDAKNYNLLLSLGITHVVSVGAELKVAFPRLFQYLHIPAKDSPDFKLLLFFDEIADFIHSAIDKEKGKVLVHCYWGISRSSTAVLAYLVRYRNMSLADARSLLKQKRSIVYPNEGFIQQLVTYEKKVTSKKSKVYGYQKDKPAVLAGGFGAAKFLPIEEQEKYSSAALLKKSQRNISIGSSDMSKLMNLNLNRLPSRDNAIGLRSGSVSSRRIIDAKNPEKLVSVTQREVKSIPKDSDYCCANCGFKLFDKSDVIHEPAYETKNQCNGIYIKHMPWFGLIKTDLKKLYCPNPKCNFAVGFANQKGGGCGCGFPLSRTYLMHQQNISNPRVPKVIQINRPKAPEPIFK